MHVHYPYYPYDVKIVIYRYLHEMNMCDIRKELSESINLLENCIDFFRKRTPQLFMARFYKLSLRNPYIRLKCDLYIHRKKMEKCLPHLIK